MKLYNSAKEIYDSEVIIGSKWVPKSGVDGSNPCGIAYSVEILDIIEKQPLKTSIIKVHPNISEKQIKKSGEAKIFWDLSSFLNAFIVKESICKNK